jgi:hypothetical protein
MQQVGMSDAGARVTPARLVAWSLVALVLTLAVGGLTSAVVYRSGPLSGPTDTSGYGVGDPVAVPFGAIQVTDVGEVDGVTHRALAGATHGVKSYVDGAHATVQTTIRLANSSGSSFTYHETQFRLRVTRKGKVSFLRADGGNLPDTVIAPHSDVAGHLDFTIRRVPAELALVFTPVGHAGPVVIDLGKAAFDARAPGGHQH